MATVLFSPTVPAPRTEPRPVLIPAPRPALAVPDDLPWCTCLVPLNGTEPHYRHCDLRGGAA